MTCALWIKEIQKNVQINQEKVLNYLEKILSREIAEFKSYEDVYDCVGEFLISCYPRQISKENAEKLCHSLFLTLNIDPNVNLKLDNEESCSDILEQPISIAEILKSIDDSKTMSTNHNQHKDEKLIKEDERQKEKMRKKTSGVQVVECKNNTELTANQTISKTNRSETSSFKIMDVVLESIDLLFGSRVLLKDASCAFHYGKRYGIIGRNGCGKTTLFRAISRRELFFPSHISIIHVEQEVNGNDTTAIQTVIYADSMIETLKKEEKSILESLNKNTEDESSDMLSSRLKLIYDKLQNFDEEKALARASTILSGLGFSQEAQNWPTRNFSGGWRMRIALAKALFAMPDVLLLDEPTNMLDLKVVLWLEQFLDTWPSTLLLISHDKYFLNSVVTDVIHVTGQKLEHYQGNYDTFLRVKNDKVANQNRQYNAQMMQRQHIQAFVDRFRANANRASQAQSKIKVLEKMPDLKPVEEEPDVVFKFPASDKIGGYLLKLENVTFGYNPEKILFKNLSLSCNYDSRITIVGENGSGKTTFLRLLLGELEPSTGLRTAHRNLRVGYFCQHHIDALPMNMNSIQILAKSFPGRTELEYRNQLGQFGLSADLATRPVSTLSGGQKSRAAFALIAMARPNFLILDEPTNHLDIETVEALCKAINQFNGGVILVSHNEELIKTTTKELWICRSGKITNSKFSFDEYKKILSRECNQSMKLSTL